MVILQTEFGGGGQGGERSDGRPRDARFIGSGLLGPRKPGKCPWNECDRRGYEIVEERAEPVGSEDNWSWREEVI